MKQKRTPRPALPQLTGENYPHQGYVRKGRDPRMVEYLENLEAVIQDGIHERILWVLCAGVWWLKPEQAQEVAAVLARMFEHEP